MTDMEITTAKWTWWTAPALRWLTGPIFDKEMRVSSRRRRSYVLRFVYIGLFTFMVAVLWADRVAQTTTPGYTSVYQVSRMASAGQQIITAVLWFQFLAAQVLAIVMLSTSISDEIYKRTLGTLMTTPIGSFQIVIGKLASKLLQIVLLLAISLPLLAVVRVFGGVPWGYLLCGLCVTLTAVVFVGSLSLFFSIFTRRAYTAILEAIVATGFLFGFVPMILVLLISPKGPSGSLMSVLSYTNPYVMMAVATQSLYSARAGGYASWPLHCAVMLGVSSLLLLLAMIFVRKAALRQAVGATPRGCRDLSGQARGPAPTNIRRVVGPPVLWKERRSPLLGKRKVTQIVAALVILGALVLTYWLGAREHALREPEIHVVYTVVFLGAGLLFTMVLPATCITAERESQTWPLLLTTTVGTWEILWSKFVGALRRCLPAWLLLFGHVAVFVALGIIHPIALVQLGILVVWILLFLTSTGLYFSTRLRHTTTAVIANMALAAGLWAVFPLGLTITLELARTSVKVVKIYMDMNPFVQAGVVVSALVHGGKTGARGGFGSYDWLQGGMTSMSDATGWIVLTCAVYVSVGLIFLTLAASRLRRNPF
jgi:ABC-type transport system involved in multi-copper enzyme maturation permease subunit